MTERVVKHSRYGPGVVQKTRFRGYELCARFADGLTRWVRFDEVTEITAPSPAPSRPRPLPRQSSGNHKPRRMIEAFRYGIVPHDCVREFTFGREREIEKLREWFNNPGESTLLLRGEYGTGKTHLVDYIYWLALHENFAVARVYMDPNESPFYKPKRVYSQLVRTLQYRGPNDNRIKSYRDLLEEVLGKGAWQDHQYFRNLINRTSDENLWDWIEAREPTMRPWLFDDWIYLPGLYDYQTAANVYCYLLSALGWAAKEVLGLKGLLLVFDETESIDSFYYHYQWEKSKNFLHALIRTAENDKRLLDKPCETGLVYCKMGDARWTPFLYRQPSGLKILLASTSTPTISGKMNCDSMIELRALSDVALRDVFGHICRLYAETYDFPEDDLTIDMIFRQVLSQGGRTRMFVKGAVEALDLVRFNRI